VGRGSGRSQGTLGARRHAYGLADRKRRIANTVRTRFRIGSMNKMFTAVATLQLVEAGKVALTAPLGSYLPGYPNREVATKVPIHQLLTHTGGTGDIFGPDFDAHRTELRTLDDDVELYGARGLEFEPGRATTTTWTSTSTRRRG
jgi:D-alanyl-D-alanine carboxypeptidase